MQSIESKIVDALDVETFFVCDSEEEGRALMLGLLNSFGYKNCDVVYVKHESIGARVRGRAYIHKPADNYSFLKGQ